MSCLHECSICFETIMPNVNRVLTECGHEFHCNCLMKNVTSNNYGCPLCRATVAEATAEEEEDDEDNNSQYDELNSYNEEYSEDIRIDPDLTESHLLRGFRWLFYQQVETATVEEPADDEDEEEEEEEEEWKNCVKRTQKVQTFSKELVNDLLIKRIPYEKLLNMYLCHKFPDTFDFIEFQRDDDHIFHILDPKVTILENELAEEDGLTEQ